MSCITSTLATSFVPQLGSAAVRLEDSMYEVIEKAKQGATDAVNEIWDRYFPEIVHLAGKRMAGENRRMADEEDVAISVMGSFFQAAQAGRFPDLRDKDGIWRLLCQMTRRKVIDYVRRNKVRPAVTESGLARESEVAHPLEAFSGGDPTPHMIAVVTDEIERMLSVLPEKYHAIAMLKLECKTMAEIAEECGIHVRTVERRMQIIRGYWAKAQEPDE